jgi:enoyl-CoA hydratase/carnithine racemase
MLSDTVTTEHLERFGLINRLVEIETVIPTARELASRLAEGPTRALGLTKRTYRNSLNCDFETVFEEDRTRSLRLCSRNQTRQRVTARRDIRPGCCHQHFLE